MTATRSTPDPLFKHLVPMVLGDKSSIKACLSDLGTTTYRELMDLMKDHNKVNSLKWRRPLSELLDLHHPFLDTRPIDVIFCLRHHDISALMMTLFGKLDIQFLGTSSIKRQHIDVVIFGEHRHLADHLIDGTHDFQIMDRGVSIPAKTREMIITFRGAPPPSVSEDVRIPGTGLASRKACATNQATGERSVNVTKSTIINAMRANSLRHRNPFSTNCGEIWGTTMREYGEQYGERIV